MPTSSEKNRYRNAKHGPDFIIDQDWESYSTAEHDRWDRLIAQQQKIVKNRACRQALEAISALQLSGGGIPEMEKLSARLRRLTGWEVVPVAELVPDEVFFNHLANRRFPAGAFIRPEEEFEYLEEPDVFHDMFGHVPLLADPVFSDFMQAYGKGGKRAMKLGQLKNLARLYWYTVEFGLVKENGELKIYGAGILSSPKETVFSLENESPNRIAFDLERVMRTEYIIDDFQKTYFVISDFESLLEACYNDFGIVYETVKYRSDLAPHEIVESDQIITAGSLKHFGE